MIKFKKNVYELLESMVEAIEFIKTKILRDRLDNEIVEVINVFIESFVSINNCISEIKSYELECATNNLADMLVKIVSAFDSNKYNFVFEIFNLKIVNEFYSWKEKIEKNIKFKIIIYGVNNYNEILHSILNCNRTDIIAYIDDSNEKIGAYFNGKKIISIDNIENYFYDYILVLGGDYKVLNRKVESGYVDIDKIFDFWRYYTTNFDYNFHKKYYEFIENDKDYVGTITGLSYFEVGINVNFLKKKFYNFAVSSQDLFFDYQIMKYMLSYKELKNNIKYAIIGLSYYSFQYDMSKSNRKMRANIYYPIFKTMHNYEDSLGSIETYNKFKEKSKLLLCHNFQKNIYYSINKNTEEYLHQLYNQKFNSKSLTSKEMFKQKEVVKRLFDKDYPNTVRENKKILENYLELLNYNNIKPIIIVCPHNKFFVENSPKGIKKQFLSIINEYKDKYDFQFIDYFNCNKFNENDFYDVSHLNYKGAEKFTKILNDEIEW